MAQGLNLLNLDLTSALNGGNTVNQTAPINNQKAGAKTTTQTISENVVKAVTKTKKEEIAATTATVTQLNQYQLSLKDIIDKVNSHKKEMNKAFLEREREIDDLFRAIVARLNILYVGPPGTGKSLLVVSLSDRIVNSKKFTRLLSKTTDPSELFGPFSVKGMENDKFARKTENTLVDSHLAFLDETLKCNSPVLNSLLTIMNERQFYNDDPTPIDVPLISLIGASNEFAESDELSAFSDRFVFKKFVSYLKKDANIIKMLKNKVSGAAKVIKTDLLTLEEINYLNEMVDSVSVSDVVINNMAIMFNELKQINIIISDRKKNQLIDVLRAEALLNARDYVAVSDFYALADAIWDQGYNLSEIEAILTKIADPYKDKINTFKKQFKDIKAHMDSVTDDYEKRKEIPNSNKALSLLGTELTTAIRDMRASAVDTVDFEKLQSDVNAYNATLVKYLLNDSTIGTV